MPVNNGGTTSHRHSHACQQWGHHVPSSFSCLPTMGAPCPIVILMLANNGGTTSHCHSHACQQWGHHVPSSFSCLPTMGVPHPIIILMLANNGGTSPIVILMLANDGGITSHCRFHAFQRWGGVVPFRPVLTSPSQAAQNKSMGCIMGPYCGVRGRRKGTLEGI